MSEVEGIEQAYHANAPADELNPLQDVTIQILFHQSSQVQRA